MQGEGLTGTSTKERGNVCHGETNPMLGTSNTLASTVLQFRLENSSRFFILGKATGMLYPPLGLNILKFMDVQMSS
jgi:hypothetical protein